ncbi:MAG TPA: hypothetical protein VMZ22_05005 [Acidimicrobiales bacterium]|nr:hypothetical protein [Acidimicrobiales bacterium]
MGWCHEFGPQITESCEHPMTAYSDRCECTVCGTVCAGRFAGCGSVWERGPREVSVNAPRLSAAGADDSQRWRLPLGAPARPDAHERAAAEPAPMVLEVIDEAPAADRPAFETPDVTTRYAVAQLEELNNRVASLTEETTGRAALALEKVYDQLRHLSSQREVDLTEHAAGIYGAVQAGTDALVSFGKVVSEVTEDLRAILNDALKAIGGTDGLAAWVAAAASDIQETREEFAASLGKIERDITLLRRRSNAEAKAETKAAKIDDEQVAFIVDAVTESVLAALENNGRKRR